MIIGIRRSLRAAVDQIVYETSEGAQICGDDMVSILILLILKSCYMYSCVALKIERLCLSIYAWV